MSKQHNKSIKEGSIQDYRSQIILALQTLEHGMHEFNNRWVFEAAEEDMLCELIETALKQYGEQCRKENDIDRLEWFRCLIIKKRTEFMESETGVHSSLEEEILSAYKSLTKEDI